MAPTERRFETLGPLWRALIEILSIIFLFYSNLLMGEFERSNQHGKSLAAALGDIFTGTNLLIALLSATVGFLFFEALRKHIRR